MKKEDFDLNIFAQRFRDLLQGQEENTHSLAKKLGLTPATISRYANAKMAPKLPTLYAIADIYNVNPLWLYGFDVPMERSAPETSRDERLNILYELTKELSEDELTALKGFVAGLKANRKPD